VVSVDRRAGQQVKILFSRSASRGEQQVWAPTPPLIQRKNRTDWLELVPKRRRPGLFIISGPGGHPSAAGLSLCLRVAQRSSSAGQPGDPFNDGSRRRGRLESAEVQDGTNVTWTPP
jgi:hypothetical protein